MKFSDLWDLLWPFVPPSIGAYFGLKWSAEQTRKERITTWFCSAFLSLFLGQGVGEYFALGVKTTSGVSILIAMLISDAMGAITAVARQWMVDPVETFRRWRNAWFGRGGNP